MESKSTTGASLGVKFDWLSKISDEARSEGKSPALSMSFVRPDGTPHMDGQWVAIPLHVWQRLTR